MGKFKKKSDISNFSIKLKKQPNAITILAMNELKAGKGRKFESVAELFLSV
ncbi:MAG: hypothetical protein V4619_18410 [Bacteroidota bacterium]